MSKLTDHILSAGPLWRDLEKRGLFSNADFQSFAQAAAVNDTPELRRDIEFATWRYLTNRADKTIGAPSASKVELQNLENAAERLAKLLDELSPNSADYLKQGRRDLENVAERYLRKRIDDTPEKSVIRLEAFRRSYTSDLYTFIDDVAERFRIDAIRRAARLGKTRAKKGEKGGSDSAPLNVEYELIVDLAKAAGLRISRGWDGHKNEARGPLVNLVSEVFSKIALLDFPPADLPHSGLKKSKHAAKSMIDRLLKKS